MFIQVIIVIIIISRCAGRHIRLSLCPPNPPRYVPPPWPHFSSSTPPCLSLFRQSFSKWSLDSLSPFDLLVSTPCCKTVVYTLSPGYVSQPVPPSSHLTANFIDLCYFNYSLVYHSLRSSNPKYPFQALALETVQFSFICFCDLPCFPTIKQDQSD